MIMMITMIMIITIIIIIIIITIWATVSRPPRYPSTSGGLKFFDQAFQKQKVGVMNGDCH